MPDIKPDMLQGAWTDGDIRYVMIRADGLMGAFQNRPEDLAALEQSIYTHGRKSLLRYQSVSLDSASLLATVTQVASFLGWGIWQFTTPDATHLRLSVRNSPFAILNPPGPTGACAPILGMFRAVCEVVLRQPIQAREYACAASGAACCEFRSSAQALSSPDHHIAQP